jgi:hypothetical protein
MPAGSVIMGVLKKQVTIVFLAIFTLIKISPVYYQYQLIPAFGHENVQASIKHVDEPANQNILIRVYKSIVEKNDYIAVPKIIFSGTPFGMFFLEIGLVLLTVLSKFAPSTYPNDNTETYLLHKVFRL